MREVSHTQFTKSHEEGKVVLVAEVSDLFKDWPSEQDRVWPDACDVGLRVMGRRQPVDFVVQREVRDAEGELVSFELAPTPESIRRVPACAKARVVIYND